MIEKHLQFFLAFRTLSPAETGTLVVDIGDTLDTKLEAIATYKSQFPPHRRHILDRFRSFAEQQGMAAGYAAGELFASTKTLGTPDLMNFLFAAGGTPPNKK